MQIPFTKMHGLGNDFVLIDERNTSYALTPQQIAHIADRRFGIGCDQLLILDRSVLPGTDGRYRIFNADSTPAEHCGNGVRCVARYLMDAGDLTGNDLALEINGCRYSLSINHDGTVCVDMGRPQFQPAEIPITAPAQQRSYSVHADGLALEMGCVSMGNPHALILVDDVVTAEVQRIGNALQSHEFFPARVNVGFLQIVDRNMAKLRVFERGVGETMACGTGACAAMALGLRWGALAAKVTIALPGGELAVEWSGEAQTSLFMTGPAERVFDGIIPL